MKDIRSLILAIITIAAISSCKKDETKAPEFLTFELGYDNSGTALVGDELHIDAEIFAEGKIATIQIKVHPESEHGNLKTPNGWEFDSIYTVGYAGAKNIDFHEDMYIPAEAAPGEYHFQMSVTDQEGNRTIKEAELLIQLPVVK